MVLTAKQTSELNGSIISYLLDQGYTGAAEELTRESGCEAGMQGLLEKKWTSVVKLQKKIMELEAQVEALGEEVKGYASGQAKKVNVAEMIPRACKHTMSGHRDTINSVKFHPVFNVIASASNDATIKFWDFESGTFEKTLKSHTEAVEDICFNKTGTLMASCSTDLTIKIWDIESAEYSPIKTLYGHDHSVSSIVFTANGEFLISCSRDKTVKVWDTSTGFCVKTIDGHEQWVRQVVVCNDLIATASSDQTAKVFNWKTGACLFTLRDHEHVVETVRFSSVSASTVISAYLQIDKKDHKEGEFLATGCRDKAIRIFSMETGQCIMTLNGHDNWVRSILFHPCGKFLISSSDDATIRVWDLTRAKLHKKFDTAHENFITTLDWSTTFPALASAGVDQQIKIWDLK